MNWRVHQLRCRLYDRRLLTTIIILSMLCTGGWLSYTAYVAPGERIETREHTAWEVMGTVSHGADIAEPTPIYPETLGASDSGASNWTASGSGNATAEANGNETSSAVGTVSGEPLYYLDIAPVAHGEIAVEHTAPETVGVGIELRRVTRATDGDTVYWTDEEQLGTAQRDAGASDPVSVPFELNLSAVAARVDDIESQIGASPGETETRLRADVTINGTVDGDTASMARTLQVDVDRDGSTYSFDIDEPLVEPVTKTTPVTVDRSYGPVWTVGGPAFIAAGVVGGLVLIVVQSNGRPTPDERTWVEYQADRDAYEDIVVNASLPAGGTDLPTAHVETLGALCDLAVDAGEAVIYEEQADQYVVRRDGVLYSYHPPQPPT